MSDPEAEVRPRVLVVEDDPDLREVLVMFLESHWDVKAARDGLEAIETLDDQAFDAVLLDLSMPRLDGEGVIRRMQERRMSIPVVLMSASEELSGVARRHGVAEWLPKPCEAQHLERVLERVIH